MSDAACCSEIDTTSRPGWARWALGGRLTVSSATRLRDEAVKLAGGGGDVCVCCEGAEYLDAAVIQVLICLGRDVVGRGKRFDIANVPVALAGLFRAAGLGNGA